MARHYLVFFIMFMSAVQFFHELVDAQKFGLAAKCPNHCTQATAWCHSVFGIDNKGGVLTARQCQVEEVSNSSTNATAKEMLVMNFSCTCNALSEIFVSRKIIRDDSCVTSKDQFEPHPSVGRQCRVTTGTCPSPDFCSVYEQIRSTVPDLYTNDTAGLFTYGCAHAYHVCSSIPAGAGYTLTQFQCHSCVGGTYIIVTNQSTHDGNGSCTKSYLEAPADSCDPMVDCSGHGCCRPSQPSQCVCVQSSARGYWDEGSNCRQCHPEYDEVIDPTCRTRKKFVEIFFERLSTSTLTTTVPFLFGWMFFLVLSSLRRRWVSDEELYILPDDTRGALNGMSPNAGGNIRDPSGPVFKSLAIPPRPSRSVGMVRKAEKERERQIRARQK